QLTGCTLADEVFIAAGAMVGNGAHLGRAASVAPGAVVHLGAIVAPHARIPAGWVAVGDPARSYPPGQTAAIRTGLAQTGRAPPPAGLRPGRPRRPPRPAPCPPRPLPRGRGPPPPPRPGPLRLRIRLMTVLPPFTHTVAVQVGGREREQIAQRRPCANATGQASRRAAARSGGRRRRHQPPPPPRSPPAAPARGP